MTPDQIEAAAQALAGADRSHQPIAALPGHVHPASPAEAHAIQERLVALSGETIAGWKIATTPEGVATWGVIYERDVFESPARVAAGLMPMRGIEGEVAFRFTADLPARAAPYSRAEIRTLLAAIPVIEIVDTRFADYAATPVLDRLADRMSNGGLVVGTAEAGADARDLSKLRVTLIGESDTLLDQVGGHSRGDPLLPVIDFVNARQQSLGFHAGELITAGTLTGLIRGEPGGRYRVTFEGLGTASVTFV
jgi:2-keto-4-pentenoate hydratase